MTFKERVYSVLRGKFLVDRDAPKNWVFIVFLAILGLMMIASSHSVDKKVQRLAKLTLEKKENKAKYIATKSELMQLELQSSVAKKVSERGLEQASEPPVKIVITKKIEK
jgi:hypothetical protein